MLSLFILWESDVSFLLWSLLYKLYCEKVLLLFTVEFPILSYTVRKYYYFLTVEFCYIKLRCEKVLLFSVVMSFTMSLTLVPAAAVISAPIAYMNDVVVENLVCASPNFSEKVPRASRSMVEKILLMNYSVAKRAMSEKRLCCFPVKEHTMSEKRLGCFSCKWMRKDLQQVCEKRQYAKCIHVNELRSRLVHWHVFFYSWYCQWLALDSLLNITFRRRPS